MKRLSVAAAVAALVALPATASANQGFYDSYGYHMPGKYQPAPAAKPEVSLFNFGKKSKKASAQAAQDAQPVLPSNKKTKKIVDQDQGGGELSGGPRPHISAVAPPKVAFPNSYGAGHIVIDTAGRKLYYVLSSSQAYRYPIAVGKQGFTWTGTEKISREVDWPDWRPPAEMLERKPNLPELMTGGIRNPLGAKALYLGNTLYRIHGTNDPKSIGRAESSGCFRMLNAHVLHLASLVQIGTQVTVVRSLTGSVVASEETQRPRATARPAAAPRWQYRPRPRWYETYDDYR